MKSYVKEPLILTNIEQLPWYQLGIYIYELYGEWYLIVVDYYSKCVEIENLNKNLSSKNVIQKLNIFSRHGIPAIVITDSGTQLISTEMRSFVNE